MILKNFKEELNKEEPTFARDIKRRNLQSRIHGFLNRHEILVWSRYVC